MGVFHGAMRVLKEGFGSFRGAPGVLRWALGVRRGVLGSSRGFLDFTIVNRIPGDKRKSGMNENENLRQKYVHF